jgi:hypothetical protein
VQIIHGISIPVGKLGIALPRTISQVWSAERNVAESFHVRSTSHDSESGTRNHLGTAGAHSTLPRVVQRIGRSIIPARPNSTIDGNSQAGASCYGPASSSSLPTTFNRSDHQSPQGSRDVIEIDSVPSEVTNVVPRHRAIQFADDQPTPPAV